MATKKSNNSGSDKVQYVWAAIRICLALIFLWAFADKMFGLGNTTCLNTDAKTKVQTVEVMCSKATIKGGSPTTGFLKNAAKGPMKTTYNKIAGNKVVDFLFMAGLLLIGLSLLTGIGIKVAVVSGVLLMVMMWSAVLSPANHPFMDDHLIYALALVGISMSNDKQVWGLGGWWKKQSIVKKYPVLA